MPNEKHQIRTLAGEYRAALKEEFRKPEKDWGKGKKPTAVILEKIQKIYRQADRQDLLEIWFYMLKELTWPTLSDSDAFVRHLCTRAHELVAEYEREYGRL